ncbi:MAG: SDR family NAD(P)-dependent oxidoreductase [Spirochaetia bacterium]
MPARDYENKVVVVTGASTGIGAEIARELARRGGHAVLVARREDLLAEIGSQISREGGLSTTIPCDLTDETSLRALVAAIRERFSQVHLLVNNAGRELMMPLQVTKPQTAREILELNVVALAELTRQCLPLLKAGSAIVNMTSVAGFRGDAGLSLYAASKGAVIALTRSLAKELASRRVRVNAVAPGIVKTEMMERMFSKLTAKQVAEIEAAHPLGFGSPRDIARSVAFLGSDDAAWITGHVLVVDGGFSA